MIHKCYAGNSGFCFGGCGRPMNFDYWLAAKGGDAYNNWRAYKGEWDKLVRNFGEKK